MIWLKAAVHRATASQKHLTALQLVFADISCQRNQKTTLTQYYLRAYSLSLCLLKFVGKSKWTSCESDNNNDI